MLAALMTLLLGVFPAVAQEQESKLVDRLLKPNTTLANSAQDKKFVAPGLSIDKHAPARSFYSPDNSVAKPFAGERAFSPKQFAARHFRAGDTAANLSSRSQVIHSDTVILPPTPLPPRAAPESGTTVAVAPFSRTRPFLDRGKSQKSLSAANPPLTIEQVRELLNKSK